MFVKKVKYNVMGQVRGITTKIISIAGALVSVMFESISELEVTELDNI